MKHIKNTETIRRNYDSLITRTKEIIAERIKSTGKLELTFSKPIVVAYYYAGLDYEWDGNQFFYNEWGSMDISAISINEKWGNISNIYNAYNQSLDFDNMHSGEWVYILEKVEEQLKADAINSLPNLDVTNF